MTSVMSPSAAASSERILSAITDAPNRGAAADGSALPAVPAARRTASSRASQKSCASRWSRRTCTTASWSGRLSRPAQARNSDDFPLPAGAEMIVTFLAAASSRAARRSPRSISRGGAGATSQACLVSYACHHSLGEAVLAPSLLRSPKRIQPSGLGWLPDGRLLILSMRDASVLRVDPDGTVTKAADDLWFPTAA